MDNRVFQREIEKEIRTIMLQSPYHRATIEDSKWVLECLLRKMQDWLCEGRSIQLPYLGTLTVRERPARMIKSAFRRKGSKADAVAIGRRRNVTFRDGAQLKRALRRQIEIEENPPWKAKDNA